MVKKCFLCGKQYDLHRHHIFGGRNRKLSEKYKLYVNLCFDCHVGDTGVHFNKKIAENLHRMGQAKFKREHPGLDFAAVFGKNYL